MHKLRLFISLVLYPPLLVGSLIAQFRTNVDVVLVPVSVTDRRGTPISGLTAGHFALYEDKKQQKIVSFASQEEPVSVGLVLDVSGSMGKFMPDARALVRHVLRDLDDRDEVFLLGVSSRSETVSEFTANISSLQAKIDSIRTGGQTALIDTMMEAFTRIRASQRSRRAIVVVSDGAENHSRFSRRDLLRAAVESGAPVFSVALTDFHGYSKPTALNRSVVGSNLLKELSEAAGGLHVQFDRFTNSSSLGRKMALAIRNQYVLSYSPSSASPGDWRRIRVKAEVPGAIVTARRGYYSP